MYQSKCLAQMFINVITTVKENNFFCHFMECQPNVRMLCQTAQYTIHTATQSNQIKVKF